MKKKYILKDSTGKYYTKYWDGYWSKNPDNAYEFDSEDEILKEYDEDKKEEYPQRFREAASPLYQETIYVLDIDED